MRGPFFRKNSSRETCTRFFMPFGSAMVQDGLHRYAKLCSWIAPILMLICIFINEGVGNFVMTKFVPNLNAALTDVNTDLFVDSLWKCALLYLLLSTAAAGRDICADLWALNLRARGTYYFHRRYFSNLILANEIDNADHRITQDLTLFCRSVASITESVAKLPIMTVVVTVQLWQELGYEAPLSCYLYVLLSVLWVVPVTRVLARLTYEQEEKEGSYRFQHAMQRAQAGDITLLNGGAYEEQRANAAFSEVFRIRKRFIGWDFIYQLMLKFNAYYSTLVYYGVLGLVFLVFFEHSEATAGGRVKKITKSAYLCIQLMWQLSQLCVVGKEVGAAIGLARRLTELKDQLNTKNDSPTIGGNTPFMRAEYLDVGYKEVLLLSCFSWNFEEGEHVLFTGPSGCGKTTLMRILCGVTAPLQGLVHHDPRGLNYAVVSQRPYFPKCSVWDLLHYPEQAPLLNSDESEEAARLLALLGLRWKITDVEDWLNVVSPGEAQRFACLRAYWQKPNVLFVDEGTSHVDEAMETTMYELMLEGRGCAPTIISFGHRTSLVAFHRHHVTLSSWMDLKDAP